MKQIVIMEKLEEIIQESKVGILSSRTKDSYPHMRWMTVVTLDSQPGKLYAVTSGQSSKVADLKADPHVEWLFQRSSLKEMITVRGRVKLIKNPSLQSEVQTALGGNMSIFWRVNKDTADITVLETDMEDLFYFNTTTGDKQRFQVKE